MKGREMVILVNGFIFTGVAAAIALYARMLQAAGHECRTTNQTLCERNLVVGFEVSRSVPWLFAIGVLLLGIAATLIAHRIWFQGRPE